MTELNTTLATGFVIPNGSWGRDDDWTRRPDNDKPGYELLDPPEPPLYWTAMAD